MLEKEMLSEMLVYLDHLTWLSSQKLLLKLSRLLASYQPVNSHCHFRGVSCFLVPLKPKDEGRMLLWNVSNCLPVYLKSCPWKLESSYRLAVSWMVRESNADMGEIFHTCPDQPWDPPSLLYNGYSVSSQWVKRRHCRINHPPPILCWG